MDLEDLNSEFDDFDGLAPCSGMFIDFFCSCQDFRISLGDFHGVGDLVISLERPRANEVTRNGHIILQCVPKR